MKIPNLVSVVTAVVLTACASSPRYGGGPEAGEKAPGNAKGGYYPVTQTGVASYYAEDFHGKLTATGETYDMYGLSAAHKTLPLNTIIRVTNMENKKTIILRVNDRGPFAKGRILDCSYGAALKLGYVGKGTARVRIEVIELGDDEYMKHKE